MKIKLDELIRRRREALGLSKSELARRLGVVRTHVGFLERGQHRPSISLIKRLASTLGLDARRLFLLSYPEARFLFIGREKRVRHKPDDVWRRFANDRALRELHRVTARELEVLRQVSRLGSISTPRQLLFVLNTIRVLRSPRR